MRNTSGTNGIAEQLSGHNSFILLDIDNKTFRAFLDNGAQINLIRKSSVPGKSGITGRGIQIKGINGKSLTYGTINLEFAIDNVILTDSFHIVDNDCTGNYDIYLGLKFLLDKVCVIDYSSFMISGTNFSCRIYIDEFIFVRSAIVDEIDSVVNELDSQKFSVVDPKQDSVVISIANSIVKFRLGHLSADVVESIASILSKYPGVFEELTCDNRSNLTFESLDLNSNKYIQTAIYRLPPAHHNLVKEEMKRLLDLNIISHSKSPFNSPVWIVPKKGDEGEPQQYRIVIDYRRLNQVTIQDHYPLPRIEDIIDQLGGAKFFTVMDLLSGFHQISLRPEDRYKTGFSVFNSHYEFNALPYGLINAAPAFQRIMTSVLCGLVGEICFVYIDDIVVYGRTMEEHNKNLDTVLERLNRNKLKVKPSKCHFLKEEIRYLGFLISNLGVKMDPKKTEAIRNFVEPKNEKQLRSFLGLANFYRHYISNFSSIARSLFDLLKKKVMFEWSDKCQLAFNKLIEKIADDVILQYPDFTKTFHLTTDSSNYGLGAVLSQKDDNGYDRPISFISRALNDAERNYGTTEKECLAIIWSVYEFKHYLTACHFVIYTDHRALVWLYSVKDPGQKLIRWRLKLNNFNYEVRYTPGKSNYVADELSRNGYCNIEYNPFSDEKIIPAIGAVEVDDGDDIIEDVDDHEVIDFCPRIDREKITDDDMISELIREQHCGPIGGHRGINATEKAINIYFDIPNLRRRVIEFIGSCDTCQRVKINRKHRALPLTLISSVSEPNEKIAFDVIGPFKYPNQRKLYGLTIQDEFSKFILFCGIRDCTAETIAKALVESWILYYGIPKILLSDNGANLCGEIMTQISAYFNIKRITTSIAHPQSNGSVERAHARLAEFIRATEKEIEEEISWESKLKLASFCYNNTVHATTGYTPYYLMFGRRPRLISGVAHNINLIPDTYLENFHQNLQCVWDKARDNIEKKRIEAKDRDDRKVVRRSIEEFKVGDWIMLDTCVEQGHIDKLDDRAKGPYKVLQVRDTNLVIKKRLRECVVNKANCALYKGDIKLLKGLR